MDIMSIGEMVIDFLPGGEPGVYIRKPGGAPANMAIAMARGGCDAGFCGKVGDDDFGRFLSQTLRDNHVRQLVPEPESRAVTTMAFVTLREDGERSFVFARKPGADMFLSQADIQDAHLDESTVIHAGSCSLSAGDAAQATVYALREGRRRGKLVSFDLNYRDLLWGGDRAAAAQAVAAVLPYVDLLKVSDEEIDMIGGEEGVFAAMERYGLSAVAETLGAEGSRCYFQNKILQVPGHKAVCIDATGAGDAFWGGFLTSLIRAHVRRAEDLTQDLLLSAMRYGNVAGWLCVQRKGAIESLPTYEEVISHLEAFTT